MNDHNLDDLIIDNIEPKNSKTKSILTIIALLIVVLIVAIILTKIILKDPNTEQLAIETGNIEMISPELTLQNATQNEEIKEEIKLSNIMENEPKAPETVVQPIDVPKIEEVKKEIITERQETIKTVKEHVEITKEFEQEPTVPEAKPIVKEVKKVTEVKKENITVAKPLPAKIIEQIKIKPTGRPVNMPKKMHVTQGYFIQVGSFTQTPSPRFLSIIKNSGFNYMITSASENGTKKLLIGPYDNRKTVDTALVRVRDRINKQAFVIKK